MLGPAAVFLPMIVAAVLLVSGVAKLRRPDDLDSWAELGVPVWLRRTGFLRAHPWAEILLGGALLVLGGALGAAAGVIAVGVMSSYLVVIARAVRSDSHASCACFGSRREVTSLTVVRNVWYVLLAIGALATTWTNPLWGGPAASAFSGDLGWVTGLLVAALTVIITMWPAATTAPGPSAASPEQGLEPLDYVRARTPAVPVLLADGTATNLRTLSQAAPLLLIAVSPGCGACRPVFDSLDSWRKRVPEVSIRLLFSTAPDGDATAAHSAPLSLHDPDQLIRASIAEWATPTAVLLGADGLLAGGPVTGHPDISSFIDEIDENLHVLR